MTSATSLLAEIIAVDGMIPDNDALAIGVHFAASSTAEWTSSHLRHSTSLTACYYSRTRNPVEPVQAATK